MLRSFTGKVLSIEHSISPAEEGLIMSALLLADQEQPIGVRGDVPTLAVGTRIRISRFEGMVVLIERESANGNWLTHFDSRSSLQFRAMRGDEIIWEGRGAEISKMRLDGANFQRLSAIGNGHWLGCADPRPLFQIDR